MLNGNQLCRFIKTSPKGFNFVLIKHSRCIFKQQLFSKDWSHKEIPEPIDIVKNIRILAHMIFQEVVYDEVKK